jgi:hypothetical protein
VFPLPSFFPFRIVQLYFLHTIDQLQVLFIIQRQLRKPLIIQCGTLLHEKGNPAEVAYTHGTEYHKNEWTVYNKYNIKNDKIDKRKYRVECTGGKKQFHPLMIGDTSVFGKNQITG